ncbi:MULTISPECIES: PaaI family thioesterase [unclassified Mycobacterium]|uniref:PaaI family thioesterase n=1 Tax=unclassified Mycobacterium TaxID=2642494 RepID=UPI0029C94165|nr:MULTISPECIES: PaaI family thioesterase [unclassified Mycobacterium]
MSKAVNANSEVATTPWARFGIETLVDGPAPSVAEMRMDGLCNPVTGELSAGPLAVLVDFIGGLVNFHRRAVGEWTVSTELSLELSPDALSSIASAPQVPVVASGKPFGSKGSTSVSTCEIAHRDVVVGMGVVRSFFFTPVSDLPDDPDLRSSGKRPSDLRDIMALTVEPRAGDRAVIHQRRDGALNNPLGIVHGGVAAAGLELAASAALNPRGARAPMRTASLRVNFVREFLAGSGSRYEAHNVRVGRNSGVAEAQAIGADGSVALIARVTAYRDFSHS